MKKQTGFTLIELIIVIVILGILAVTAAPKFLNLQGDANSSTIKGVDGALNSAMNIVYGKAVIAGSHKKGSGDGPDNIETDITISFGYPTADSNGIVNTIDMNLDETGTNLEDFNFESDGAGAAYVYVNGTDSPTAVGVSLRHCFVKYDEAADENTPAFTTVVTTGC